MLESKVEQFFQNLEQKDQEMKNKKEKRELSRKFNIQKIRVPRKNREKNR